VRYRDFNAFDVQSLLLQFALQLVGTGIDQVARRRRLCHDSPGLGLLPVTTRLAAPKTTTRSCFRWGPVAGSGYEIHMGQTQRGGGRPLLAVTERNGRACSDEDGCVAPSGHVMGTYLHGLFDTPGVTRAWLAAIGLEGIAVTELQGLTARDRAYDRLAAHFTRFIDTDSLLAACLGRKLAVN
ncbi:MAG: hypothetical protein R6X05_11190, partial [Desulfobacterales bacterium]